MTSSIIPISIEPIRVVGFDGDDTLWRSQDFFDAAQKEFEAILAPYIDIADDSIHDRLYEHEARNLSLFGYGVKGMALSMIEAALSITGERIAARDIHRIVRIGKALLQHPVELLPGIREAVAAIAAEHAVVLITKGDLFHQEAKIKQSGLSEIFRRIEIVSEKDPETYWRVLKELAISPSQFAMVGNSLRSDIAPVLALGAWAIHVPYHTTWRHEDSAAIPESDRVRFRQVTQVSQIAAALRSIETSAVVPT